MKTSRFRAHGSCAGGLRGFNSRLIGTPAFILNAAVTVGSGTDRAGGGHSGSAETALTSETADVFHLLDVPSVAARKSPKRGVRFGLQIDYGTAGFRQPEPEWRCWYG
ncbi:hypothetical protein [Stutzerimonas degradans]|uniref:hypothetical protein n=1 Tax=Stutzerimonas degradans TaxID=2968968 RepID=UPI0013F4E284|nr:hypothetical protein [Stutzerimonas degradans]NHC08673.1 hypothetical protein [Stutzerimonas degradans]